MYGREKSSGNYGELIVYQTADGNTRLDVKFEDETVWLTQMQMSELFQTSKQNISLHINNCFKEGEEIKWPNWRLSESKFSRLPLPVCFVASPKNSFYPECKHIMNMNQKRILPYLDVHRNK